MDRMPDEQGGNHQDIVSAHRQGGDRIALYHLDPFDIPDFLLDWLSGESIEKYLRMGPHLIQKH